MALGLTAFSPGSCGNEGGYLLTLAGSFPVGGALTASLVPPSGPAQTCLSGVPGQALVIVPLSASMAQCYTPSVLTLPWNVYAVQLANPATGEVVSLPGLLVRPMLFKTETYALRGVLPRTWALGPRTLVAEAALAPLRSS